jgi:hypothetical protein
MCQTFFRRLRLWLVVGILTATALPVLARSQSPRLLAQTRSYPTRSRLSLRAALPQPRLLAQAPSPLLAQAPSAAPQQGTQISLNGRTISTPWSQWPLGTAVRTGLTDFGLAQLLGVELLNAPDAQRQPVQWFSDPVSNPLVALTRITPPLRYLDITDLAQRWGWQLRPNGPVLQISTPAAKVLAVRHGKQPWGDRLVLELDRPAPWQLDGSTGDFGVTLDATGATLPAFKPQPGNPLQTLKLETTPNQTRLRLGSTVRPRVWTLANPPRLVVDVRPDAVVESDIQWAAGLRWRRQVLTLGTNRFPVLWLEVNPRQPGVALRPILPSATLAGTAPLLLTARQTQATAAINGGFFNRNNQFPLGAMRVEGRWLSGPILGRGAIAWDAAGRLQIARLLLQETITTPQTRLPLTHLNSAYLQAGIARYTPDWGSTYTTLTDNEIVVTVQNNQVVSQQPVAAVGSAAVAIPANGYLLVLRSNQAAAASLPVGMPLGVERVVTPPEFDRFPSIIAAGPLLVQNRQVVLDAEGEKFSKAFANELAARSAIGVTANGNVIIATVHSRLGGGGASLTDIAQLMLQLGATQALNLDGGSSTTLYLGGQIIDRPPNTAARVHNGIGVFVPPSP